LRAAHVAHAAVRQLAGTLYNGFWAAANESVSLPRKSGRPAVDLANFIGGAQSLLQAVGGAREFRLNDELPLPANPVRGVTFHPQRRREAVILPEELAEWYSRLQQVGNPLRRAMHELGLFGGLRPRTLVTLERAWVRGRLLSLEWKSGREFALPLSGHMVVLVERALGLSEAFAPGSPWLFPARGREGGVIATAVWKERLLVGETGHILRHTYRTVAKLAGVDDVDGDLLLDHKIQGVRGVYLSERALFDRLLGAEERVTAKLRALLGMDVQASVAARVRHLEVGRAVRAEARA
jgi:integrase